MKFNSDTKYNSEFDKIQGLVWYPYVGKSFGSSGKRIMVYGHNAYINETRYDELSAKWNVNKLEWANCIDEYTYEHGWWTKTFRSFVKGAVGLKSDYWEEGSGPETIQRIDSFVERIAWINFIQSGVKSNKALVQAEPEQIQKSISINREILRVLKITHCICWGKPTYNFVKNIPGYKIASEKSEGKPGFASCIIDVGDGSKMSCLKVYHPSMPGFGPFSDSTNSIISRFLYDN